MMAQVSEEGHPLCCECLILKVFRIGSIRFRVTTIGHASPAHTKTRLVYLILALTFFDLHVFHQSRPVARRDLGVGVGGMQKPRKWTFWT